MGGAGGNGRAGRWLGQGLQLLRRDPRAAFARLRRWLRPMPQPYRHRFRMDLGTWLVRHQNTIVFDQCRWMGVPSQKNPLDAWIYQEILHEVRPDVIVEIGSFSGGSTLYLAHLLDLLGHGEVISIDIDHSRFQVKHPRISTITGDSSSAPVVAQARERCAGKRVLVIHDGDHTEAGVLRDLEAYGPLVAPGSYLIVEDGVMDLFRPGDGIGSSEPGPLAASDRFLAAHPEFTLDEARERYVATYNPRGFLRRVK